MQEKRKVLFGHVVEEWLEIKKIDIKVTTYERYQCITASLIKNLGRKQIEQIVSEDFNKFLFEKQKKFWKSATIMMAIGIIKSVISFIIEKGYLKDFDLKFPEVKRNNKIVRTLTASESKALNNNLFTSKNAGDIAILIALNTGLRIGEICSLRWKDIDLNRQRLSVNGTVHRVKSYDGKTKTKLALLSPKTISSAREIPIPAFLCNILSKKQTDRDAYVLTGSTERMPEPRTIQRRFKNYCKKNLGITINFHCLRHTFATLAISKGVDVKIVCELLGHSSVTTTLNIYRGVNFEDKAQGVSTLESLISPEIANE